MNEKDNSVFTTYKKLINDALEDLKTKGRRHKQIPNILTLMRLTAPCFIIPAVITGNVPLVFGLTALFGLTDFADGFIARKWNLTSELGTALDAVTDKVFASTLLLAASISNPLLLYNLGLEAIIASINVSKKLNALPVESSYIGKVKTWFLFALVGVGIISPNLNIQHILNPLMASTTVMQLLTIGSYVTPKTNNTNLSKIEQNETSISIDENTTNNQEQKDLEKVLEEDKPSIKQYSSEEEYLEQLKSAKEELLMFKQNQPKNEETKVKQKKK